VAVEPFLQTKDLWPFIANCRQRLASNPGDGALAHYLDGVFGIGATQMENRDYRHLLEAITVPTTVIVGQIPLLPERPVEVWPSFTSAEDRALLTANPLVTLHEGRAGTGHSVQSDPAAEALLRRVLHADLLEAAKLCPLTWAPG
jgi:pimeloyl-ACP methyl ester carboxylesterase